MLIRHLETFLRIVETGSFAAAADALYTTQSTVSARVRELEKSLGVALFDRSRHRARLTPKGRELLELARRMVSLAAHISLQVGDARALSGVVRMGVVGQVAITWLPRLVAALRERYPGLTLGLDVALTATLVDRLRAADLDLALVTGPVDDTGLQAASLGCDEFVWMAAPALGVPAGPLAPAGLAGWPVLGLSEASHHYPVIQRWFEAGGAQYRPVVSCSNVRVLGELTLAGLGVSLLPLASYRKEIADGQLQLLNTRPRLPPVEFVVLQRRNASDPLVMAVAETAVQCSEFARAQAR